MRKIFINLFTILSVIFFIGCGNDDSSFSDSSSSSTKVAVSSCIEGYTDIETGDTLYQDDTSSTVSIKYYSDSSQKVCSSSGSAYLIR